MFEYDPDTRVFWFNRSATLPPTPPEPSHPTPTVPESRASLESHREFQLIGVLIGVAIYNGVILDVRSPHAPQHPNPVTLPPQYPNPGPPHVVYKKLMRQPLGMPDLQRAFPLVGRSLQQLLAFEPAEQVEETFALCMQVAYEEFGERKVSDLVEGGGEVPVTGARRANYVLRPTEKERKTYRALFFCGRRQPRRVRAAVHAVPPRRLGCDAVGRLPARLRVGLRRRGDPAISPYLPHISPLLPTSPHTSPHLPI